MEFLDFLHDYSSNLAYGCVPYGGKCFPTVNKEARQDRWQSGVVKKEENRKKTLTPLSNEESKSTRQYI